MNELTLIAATLMSGMLANSHPQEAAVDFRKIRQLAIAQAALLLAETAAPDKVARQGN